MFSVPRIRKNITNGLVGWWTFDNNKYSAGTSGVIDSSVYNRHGTQNGNPVIVSSKIGEGLSFDGNNDYIRVGSFPNLNITGELTICFWLNQRSTPDGIAVEVGNASAANIFQYVLYTDPGVIESLWSPDGNNFQAYISLYDFVAESGKWHHISFVRTPPPVTGKIYVDGKIIPNISQGNQPVPSSNFGDVTIGDIPDDFPARLDGNLDDVRIYNRSLTDNEIRDIYDYRG